MKLITIALLLAACERPPVYPMPSDPREARAAIVHAQCGDPWEDKGNSSWVEQRVGHAVLLDGGFAVTAEHVTRCPDIAAYHLTLATNETRLAALEWTGDKLAVLRNMGALDRWDEPPLHITRPALGDQVCMAFPRSIRCGEVLRITDREFEFDVPAEPGTSGSGAWLGYDLAGIVLGQSNRGRAVAQIARVISE